MSTAKFLPRDCVLVRFEDDPSLLHWRGVLVPLGGDRAVVVTPDRDIETTTLRVGPVYTEILRYEDGKLPAGVRERNTYLPKHSGQGRIDAAEFRRLVTMGERHRNANVGRRRVTGKVDARGEVSGPVQVDASGAAPEPEQVADAGQGHAFLVVFRSGGGDLGEELVPPGDAHRLTVDGKVFVVFSREGEVFMVQQVSLKEISRFQDILLSKGTFHEPPERDVRILPVLFDSADERWRTLQECVPDLEEIDFEDFPLQGPRTICHDVRQLRRLGMDFVQHHESWLKKSGVRSSDRSVYEHASLCRALNYMMCYDQLNIGALASSEALNRRRTLIEHAHQGRPDAPSYECSEEFLGIRESADGSIIDPALTQHAARRQAAKAEVLKQSRLAAEERRHFRGREDEGKSRKGEKGEGKGAKSQAPQNP